MNSYLSIHIQSPATVTAVLPDLFSAYCLPGSSVTTATGGFGNIAAQSIFIRDISLHYILAELAGEISIQMNSVDSFFFIVIQVKGDQAIVSGNGRYEFNKQNHYSVLFLSDPAALIKLPKQEHYSSLVLACPVSFISSVLSFYPLLSDWKERMETKRDIVSAEHLLSVLLSEKIYNLLHTPFVPLTEEYFFKTSVEIIREMFNEYGNDVTMTIPFNMYDINCIHAAKDYIDMHILEHPTILQVSRKAGINRLKLKKGFKAIYGIGIYGYQLQQRLLIAKTALEKTTKPVHQVARQSGYRNTSNFSAAFKRVYGVSPYQYRLQARQH